MTTTPTTSEGRVRERDATLLRLAKMQHDQWSGFTSDRRTTPEFIADFAHDHATRRTSKYADALRTVRDEAQKTVERIDALLEDMQ